MLQDELTDEVGSGWYLSFSSGCDELKNVFELLLLIVIVLLTRHEMSDQGEQSREVGLRLSLKNFVDKKLFVVWLEVLALVLI